MPPELPLLELTFSDVADDPWQGLATARFNDEVSPPFSVVEGMTSKQRADLRWYVEEFMDLPEGGNAVRARAIEQSLHDYGLALWKGAPDSKNAGVSFIASSAQC